MSSKPQQPKKDDWLLDSMQGLHDGEQGENPKLSPNLFLNPISYEYARSLQPRQKPILLEQSLRTLMAKSLWPRILINRCRSLVSALLALSTEKHSNLTFILDSLKTIMHYLSVGINGLRLALNLGHILLPLGAGELNNAKNHFIASWFELFIDIQGLITAFLPDELNLSLAFSLVEVGLVLYRGWLEYNKLSTFRQALIKAQGEKQFSAEHLRELQEAEGHAKAMLSYNEKKLVLNLAFLSFSILLSLTKYFIIPTFFASFAINPLMPLIFAGLALGLSLVNHQLGKQLEKAKPKMQLSPLTGRYSFFNKPPAENIKESFNFLELNQTLANVS